MPEFQSSESELKNPSVCRSFGSASDPEPQRSMPSDIACTSPSVPWKTRARRAKMPRIRGPRAAQPERHPEVPQDQRLGALLLRHTMAESHTEPRLDPPDPAQPADSAEYNPVCDSWQQMVQAVLA